MAEAKKTGSGLDQNIAALLAYLLAWIGGLIFILIEKENKFVRFAALQSIFLDVAMFIVWFVVSFVLGGLLFASFGLGMALFGLMWLVWIGYIVVRIVLIVKAYQNQEWELPIIGKMARKYV